MEKNKKTIGFAIIMGCLIIASAIIWGFTIIGTSRLLEGTECYDKIKKYLIGGVSMQQIILIGGMLMFIIIQKGDKKKK